MSTLVIARKGRRIAIAADSQTTCGNLCSRSEPKIVAVRDSFVGFTGASALALIFRDIVERRDFEFDFSSRVAVFRTFLQLHERLKDAYYIETQEGRNQPLESSQWHCLVASPAGAFNVDSYRCVREMSEVWAHGSGGDIALGAMHAVYSLHDDPEAIAAAGIHAACTFDIYTAMPMQLHSVEMAEPRHAPPSPGPSPEQEPPHSNGRNGNGTGHGTTPGAEVEQAAAGAEPSCLAS
ncbi:MFS transporter [Verrucomicrobia bacterium LW23]|nr:MFS transporter [Verrucomicrobia bacterium LW23]